MRDSACVYTSIYKSLLKYKSFCLFDMNIFFNLIMFVNDIGNNF